VLNLMVFGESIQCEQFPWISPRRKNPYFGPLLYISFEGAIEHGERVICALSVSQRAQPKAITIGPGLRKGDRFYHGRVMFPAGLFGNEQIGGRERLRVRL